MSPNAETLLTWFRQNASKTAFRVIKGRECPVVNLYWHGMAKAIGFTHANGFSHADIDGATRATLDAMDELRAAGFIARYDEGPGTYGHTTTCLIN